MGSTFLSSNTTAGISHDSQVLPPPVNAPTSRTRSVADCRGLCQGWQHMPTHCKVNDAMMKSESCAGMREQEKGLRLGGAMTLI